ncbi:MAG: S-layer homology domain-containing protein [Oscillospiraceae bacterium]|nr:S-layer homology domain-containing protein [Oscillospiraceae bacterium]
MKRLSVLLLALCLCLSGAVFPVHAAEAGDLADSWRYISGEPAPVPATQTEAFHPDATLRGIDVSHHQGLINWEAVRDAGIDFAIIRVGYGMDLIEQDDLYFEYNASECERLGIPYGVYLYSYATTVERADSEADHLLRMINGHTLSFPVYYDMEDDTTIGSDLAAIARTFCDKVSAAGYPVGIYANVYWWNHYLTDPCFDGWHRWVAHYSAACGYEGEYAMWQYSNTGSVSGIEGYVDMNFLIGHPENHGYPPITHSYADVVTAPTCTALGYTTHTCTICGSSYVDSYTEMLPHSYGQWETVVPATCTEKGQESRGCACGAVEFRDSDLAPHSYEDGVCTLCGDIQDPFTDVKKGTYYYDAVVWAAENGITAGYGKDDTFCPDVSCTRAQVVTFLWRAAGSPAPESGENPFTDIKAGWYYDAVLWAAEKGITAGYGSETTFSPDRECTRAEIVTFLHRYAGSPAPASDENPFKDVPGKVYYRDAVLWAVEAGITNGHGSASTFCPDVICSRGQIVTFLHRANA